MANYTWSEFLAAVDSLLLTDGNRLGTVTAKNLQVKVAVKKLQQGIKKYRQGHQEIYTNDGTVNSDLQAEGFAAVGELPENCEPRDAYIVKKLVGTVSNTVDTTDDEITVTAHGIETATGTGDVTTGQLVNTGGAVPTGAQANRLYYLRVVDANTLTLHHSAAGVIDNSDRVNLTANGTGTTTLEHSISRYPVVGVSWANRMELRHGANCTDGTSGLMAFNPNADEFWMSPVLRVGEDEDGYEYELELNWDGVKLEWDDNDTTPFDEGAAAFVAEYVKAWLLRHVDQDLAQSEMAKRESRSLKADLYLTSRRQREFRN
jgi:hypothetical protein